jgi:predicted RNase H-like nuclease
VVLGIDAAWTATEPSGVALVRGDRASWECLVAAPSYASLLLFANERVPIDWSASPQGAEPDCGELLDAATRIAGARPDIVTVDMPLSTAPITGRRPADTAVSRQFGAMKCAVHSPNATRPGAIADEMRRVFATLGFPLACESTRAGTMPALVEVYPHIALLELCAVSERMKYKAAKTSSYWRNAPAPVRRANLLAAWATILSALSTRIRGIALPFPATGTLAGLKRYEDALDALICAWVGMEYLAGRAIAYGDDTGAIWGFPRRGHLS